MSIYFSGTFTRSSGVASAITKALKLVNLKPVKKIQVQFDPFHANAKTAREFLYYISTPGVSNTNLNCLVRPNVVCDRSEPEIKIDLLDSSVIKFRANSLSVLEILQQVNKHVSSTVKADEVKSSQPNKLEKKKLKRR